jgi:hypothetical protein
VAQERKGPRRLPPLGPRSVQLRLETKLTLEQYITERAWESASFERCPLHPGGGCGSARHGTYIRKHPVPIPIVRMYCAEGHTTFSLLPDFLASRLPGTLDELEQVAVAVEAATSVEKAASELRPADVVGAVTSRAATRWTSRRMALLRAALMAVAGLLPDVVAGAGTVTDLRARLGTERALVALREMCASHLGSLPPPLGFGPRSRLRRQRPGALQHNQGEEPPD